MPNEAAFGSSQDGLVYPKYTFRYRNQFDELNDDWLDCIEATSDELLGAYTRAKDDAMTVAFGGRGKKRLNMVFDVIGFVYPDYCYPSRKQGKKRKAAASAISTTPKVKKVKVLTQRPRHIETTIVPKLTEEHSSAPGSDYPALAEAKGESAKVPIPKVTAEQQKTETAEVPERPAEARENGRRTRVREIGRVTENSEPAARVGATEGVKNSCNNSKKEENGQRTRRCYGIFKSANPCFSA
jgi:type IV secretory pathway VirB9-like protein